MAIVLVAGFVVQLSAGRSSFSAPLVVHIHAAAFMEWVAIVLAQVWLATGGAVDRHRLLGRLAVVWLLALIVLGPLVTYEAIRTQRAPFFFQPQHFLILNSLGIVAYAGLFAAAVALRKQTDWHSRLQIGAFALLMGPGIGRILPAPLLMPYAFELSALPAIVVPLIGMVRDQKMHGRVHTAWIWSAAVLVGWLLLGRLIAFSPAGDAIHVWAVAGTPLEGSDGLAFPPPPGPRPGSP
jgi:hypothetical protein